MLAIPAIDLQNGRVVRLVQGMYQEVTVYSPDPVEIARTWQKQGASRLHIVDLDGARSGEPKNTAAVRQIVENVRIPIQFGGGLRTRKDIAAIFDIGAKWVVLGTKACEDADFVKAMVAEFKEKIIVSIDAKLQKVAARGWQKTHDIEDVDLIRQMQEVGVQCFIYTDISRDGTLFGIDIAGVKRVLEQTRASLFYAGGIASMKDIQSLNDLGKQGLAGFIIGKALYEHKFDLTQVKTFLEQKE